MDRTSAADGPLKAYAREAETRTLDLLEQSLTGRLDWVPHDVIRGRLLAAAPRDVEETSAAARATGRGTGRAGGAQVTRAERAGSARSGRNASPAARCIVEEPERHEGQYKQVALAFDEEERRQLQANTRYWRTPLDQFDRDLEREPGRIRAFYHVQARRVEPVGLVYLWPGTN